MWNLFPSIRCINLRTRPDRHAEASTVFSNLNIPVNFFQTDRHPNGGIQGCFESHLEIIRQSYNAGDPYCAIFEDDVIPSNNYDASVLPGILKFLSTHPTWELFYLGTHPEILNSTTTPTGYPGIYQMNSICTHAYIISRRLMEKLVSSQFCGVPIDYLYVHNPSAFGIYPSLFVQNTSESDISGAGWNNNPLKPYWFRLVEMYAIHINLPLRYLLPIIVGLLLILYILAGIFPCLFVGASHWLWLILGLFGFILYCLLN